MRILALSRWFPFPPDNGARIRIYNLIRGLARVHQVHLISFTENECTKAQRQAMLEYCVAVECVRYQGFSPGRLSAILGFFSLRPRFLEDTFSRELLRLAEKAIRDNPFDVVLGFEIDMAPYLTRLDVPVKILEELEISRIYEEYRLAAGWIMRTRKWLTWAKLKNYLHLLAGKLDGISVVSRLEEELVRKALPAQAKVTVVPNGVDCARYRLYAGEQVIEKNSLIYPGALTYQPNFEAVQFFLADIFPRIQAACPDVRLYITGKTGGAPLDRLRLDEKVILTGYLDDLRPLLSRCSVCVVPLKSGGGTRLKILEAMAIGTPVVSTRKGAEGLELQPGVDILLADDPQEFANAVVELLRDDRLRRQIRDRARITAEERYDWGSITQTLLGMIEGRTAE